MNHSHAASILAWLALAIAPTVALAQDSDPSTGTLPDAGFANPGRALVVQVQLDDSGTAISLGSLVSAVPGRAHAGDPPLLRVSWHDSGGSLLGTHPSWDPRWEFERTAGGGERRSLLATVRASFDVPFTPAIASVAIHDLQRGTDLITVDVTDTVQSFCAASPAACAQDAAFIFANGFEPL